MISSNLSSRWRRVNGNEDCSSWKEVLQGAPQILISGLLSDLFFALSDVDIWNLADDSMQFIFDWSIENILRKLEDNAEITVS